MTGRTGATGGDCAHEAAPSSRMNPIIITEVVRIGARIIGLLSPVKIVVRGFRVAREADKIAARF